MKNAILNLEGVEMLSRKQMSTISGAADLPCRLYVYNPVTGRGRWSGAVSLQQAQSQWDHTLYSNGTYATGYCCASCA